jgi:glucose/mannose-6-phosphate isomerase
MLSFCVETPEHCREAAKLTESITIGYSKPRTIVVAGMGGSAIGGELLKDWTRDEIEVPVEVCREYSLPAYANKNTLVFVVSYSGETEETLSTFLDAMRRKCMVVSISSGGALHDFSERLNVPHVLVPTGMAPRASLPYLFLPMPLILEKIGLTSDVSVEISETVKVLREMSWLNSPEKPLSDNPAKTLAASVKGTVPIVYGFGFYRGVAQRFKTQFNENSKNPAKWEVFSELNHNDTVGWEGSDEFSKLLSVIFIREADEPDEIRRRIEATKELMSDKNIRLFDVWSAGNRRLSKMLSVVSMGDFVSIYLAVLRGVDPTPVQTISVLKDKLRRSGFKSRVLQELQKIAFKRNT